MTDIRLIYITTRDTDQARLIARELLDQRLIACANILPQMESIYRWQDQIQSAAEAVLIVKTTEQMVAQTIAAIEKLHSYDTPCALSLTIDQGAEKYLNWLRSSIN